MSELTSARRDAPFDPQEFPTLTEFRQRALAALPPAVAEFLRGGSGDEVSLRRNGTAFDDVEFLPRVMTGRDYPSTATTFLGIPLSIPVLSAPFGADGYFHPDGQKAVALAGAASGVAAMIPEASTFALETIAETAPEAARIGQLHPMGSTENFLRIIGRYEDAGYEALCLTCDCPTIGWREHNLRNRFFVDNGAVGGNYAPGGEVDMERAMGQLYAHREPVWSWDELGELMTRTSLPWIAKGVLVREDAVAAVEVGASAVYVSNHGGRQLDGGVSPLEALPGIVDAIAGRASVAYDGGVRRGSDVVKAIALGADVVVIGRLLAYGLTVGGDAGVRHVLDLLRHEIETVLVLLGRGGIEEIDGDAVRWAR